MKVTCRIWWRLHVIPDEGYMSYLMKVTCRTWWRLHVIPDEGYRSYLMKVTGRTWWRLQVIPDEGYRSYLMKVTSRTWWRLHVVPDEGYMSYLMKVTCRTWWRLHVVHTKFDIYIFTIYIYFFHNQCKIFKLLQLTCDFFFTIKLFFDYLQYSNISKLWENSNQTLSFPSHILAYSKGNNSYNNTKFRIESERSIGVVAF
jgi:hypothetical protein